MKRSNFDTSIKSPSNEEHFYYSKDGLIIFTEKYHENLQKNTMKTEDIVVKVSANIVPTDFLSNTTFNLLYV